MNKLKLDKAEADLLTSVEAGEWRSTRTLKTEEVIFTKPTQRGLAHRPRLRAGLTRRPGEGSGYFGGPCP